MFPTVILLIFYSFLQSAGKSKMPVFLLVYDLKENTHVLKQSVWLHHNITTHEVQVLLSFPTTIRINFTHFLLPHCILKHNCIFNKYMTEIELFVLNFFKKCSYWFVGSFPETGSLDTGNVFLMDLCFVSKLLSACIFQMFVMPCCSDVIMEAVYLLCGVLIKTFFLC